MSTEIETKEQTGILAIVQSDPGAVLVDDAKRGELYAFIESEISGFKPDLSTGTSRKEIASLAYKIVRTKTAIDNAGKELNAELRARIEQMDEKRRDARNTLDLLAEKARKPLTDWEALEARRQENRNAFHDNLNRLGGIYGEDTSERIKARIESLDGMTPSLEDFGDELQAAIDMRAATIQAMRDHLSRTLENEETKRQLAEVQRQQAEQAAELEALRRQEAKRKADEEAAAEMTRRETERQKQAAAQAAAEEAERQKHAREEARAKAEADVLLARQQGEARQLMGQIVADFETLLNADGGMAETIRSKWINFKIDPARFGPLTDEIRTERERIVQAAAMRISVLNQQKREELDDAAKKKRNIEIRDALMSVCELDEPTAVKIIGAIIRGKIPHITIGGNK